MGGVFIGWSRLATAMQVVVLAGGIGSRLRPWTKAIPKPLLPMLDLTLLERVVEAVPTDLVDEVIVAGGYKVDQIESYFKKNEVDFDVRIVPEDEPLGTGGALGNCRDVVSGTFACFNGDIVSSLRIEPMLDLHRKNGGVGTLALWDHRDRVDLSHLQQPFQPANQKNDFDWPHFQKTHKNKVTSHQPL